MLKNQFVEIYDMKTDFIAEPLGIDNARPRFSYKLRSEKKGTFQTAYRVLVSETEDLSTVIWDSGKVNSDCSAYITFSGKALKPTFRYFWKVEIWNEDMQCFQSNISWFETGLMGSDASVWNGAKWIGSPQSTVNTAMLSSYSVSADFKVEKGNKVGFVISARNKDNYILFEADMDNRRLMIYEYSDNAWGGSYAEGNLPSRNILGASEGYYITEEAVSKEKQYCENNMCIDVNKQTTSVSINGVKVVDNQEIMPRHIPFVPRKSFLFSIGFKQENSCAEYNNIVVTNTETSEVYQSANFIEYTGLLSVLGEIVDGKLVVANRFEVVCPVSAVNLKKDITLKQNIVKARLYASACGFYNVYINGKKVGQDFYNPGFTDYRLRIQYQSFDITDMLSYGENTVLATVAKGYYSGYCGYAMAMNYGKQNHFIAKLVVDYADGTKDIIVTDEMWKYTDKGPINDSDYLDGENYDARLDFSENIDKIKWTQCGIKAWQSEVIPTNGKLSEDIKFELSAQAGPTAKVERVMKPVSVIENPKGHYVYDLGQNIVGTVRVSVKGLRGTSIKIRYGEMCYKNGEIYIKNIRSAANTDTYTFKGAKDGEIFVPAYTSHGFRYIEITGNGYELKDNSIICSIEGLVLCNVCEVTGDFECSDKLVNKLQSNIQWGQRGNYLLVPTDCPQRNERMGWTGDAQVFAGTAAYNMDVLEFMRKWLLDLRDGQLMYNKDGAVPDTAPLGGDNRREPCAGWADAAVIVPWEIYQSYGDIKILEENYDMMVKWVEYQSLNTHQYNGLRVVDGIEVPEQSDLADISFIQKQQSRGDHLSFDETTPYILTATAYAAYVAKLLAKTADILGKSDDAKKYKARFENIKKAFNQAWVKEDGSLAYWGEMSRSNVDINGNIINKTYYSEAEGSNSHPSQTAYALAIDFGLVSDDKLSNTGKFLKKAIENRAGHLSVGFLGISHLMFALSKTDNGSMAFNLLLQQGNPSWLYSVVNGATTIWERWNSYIAQTDTFGNVSMNSFNHYAYGAVGEWMYKAILGINSSDDVNEVGYKKIVLKPTFGERLTYAKGWHECLYGMIKSSWQMGTDKATYECEIPANTTALLYLPINKSTEKWICSETFGTTCVGVQNGKAVYELLSGKYVFTISH